MIIIIRLTHDEHIILGRTCYSQRPSRQYQKLVKEKLSWHHSSTSFHLGDHAYIAGWVAQGVRFHDGGHVRGEHADLHDYDCDVRDHVHARGHGCGRDYGYGHDEQRMLGIVRMVYRWKDPLSSPNVSMFVHFYW